MAAACLMSLGGALGSGAEPALTAEPADVWAGGEVTVRAEGFSAPHGVRWRWNGKLRAERIRGDCVVLKALEAGEGAVSARSGPTEAWVRFRIRGKGEAAAPVANLPDGPKTEPLQPAAPAGDADDKPANGNLVVEKHPNGAKAAEGRMSGGERDGVWTFWDEGGRKIGEGAYRSGKRQGAWKTWDEKGRLTREEEFEDDREVRATRTTWDDKGRRIMAETVTKSGDGESREVVEWGWHDNGKMMGEKRTLNGVRDGEWKVWDESGKRMMSVVFTNGWALPSAEAAKEPVGKKARDIYMAVIGLGTNDFPRAAALAGRLSAEEQEALSEMAFQALMAMDEFETAKFERLYRLVIDACPGTGRAHEACWRLTHMYQRAFDPPQHAKIAALLEGFLARYKESTIVSMEKYPDEMLVFSPLRSLHQSYEALKQWAKIAAYYRKAVAGKKPMKPQDHFDYAKALDETGKKAEAIVWYEKFLTVAPDKESFTVELAAERLKELQGR